LAENESLRIENQELNARDPKHCLEIARLAGCCPADVLKLQQTVAEQAAEIEELRNELETARQRLAWFDRRRR
jgi:hypothetical protein